MSIYFDRFYNITITKDGTTLNIQPDITGSSLRFKFNVDYVFDIKSNTATIELYNLSPSQRKLLAFNRIKSELGTGATVTLIAGYKQGISGAIFNGQAIYGRTRRDPLTGDWITVLECSFALRKNVKVVNLADWPTNQISNVAGISTLIQTTMVSLLAAQNPINTPVPLSASFKTNLDSALNERNAATPFVFTKPLKFGGNLYGIINDIEKTFDLKFFFDQFGLNVFGKPRTANIKTITGTPVPVITLSPENGLLGSPYITDAEIRFKTLLRPDLQIGLPVQIVSSIFTGVVSINTIEHSGDTYSDESNGWITECVGLIRETIKTIIG